MNTLWEQLITFQTVDKFFLFISVYPGSQTKERALKKSAFFHKSTNLSTSFEPKRGFLWRSLNPANQTLITTLWEQIFTFQTVAKLLLIISVYHSRTKERTLQKSAFFRKSTTLSASFEPKRGFLWKSLNPTSQTLSNTPWPLRLTSI